ncbi:MAG: hypothetical protein AABX05_01825, partial [Nanoarchaeota archaeon]
MNLKIPEIKGEDLVLLYFTADRTGTGYNSTRLFYSDGRVAQTDLVLSDPKSEIAKIEVPEKLREKMREMTLNALGKFGEQYPDVVETQTNEKVWNYRRKQLIEKAISDGYLKDYIAVFGRDPEQYYSAGLEQEILNSKAPLAIFGCQQ